MSPSELIQVCSDGPRKTVSFSPDHLNSIETAPQIGRKLGDLLSSRPSQSGHDDHLHLDFRGIDRITSVGLNQLIGINSQARNCGVRLVLIDVQESVRDVFALTRLERLFEFGSSAATS